LRRASGNRGIKGGCGKAESSGHATKPFDLVSACRRPATVLIYVWYRWLRANKKQPHHPGGVAPASQDSAGISVLASGALKTCKRGKID
jgi:hypothetical protein